MFAHRHFASKSSLALFLIGILMVVGGIAFAIILSIVPVQTLFDANTTDKVSAALGLLPAVLTGLFMILAGVLALREGTHPALVLMALDIVGLVVAGYLSIVELQNEIPSCSILHGCEQVARSEYSRINGIPVAVFGVILSLTLLALAFAWWRTNALPLLAAHYVLSLVGTIFEIRFLWIQAAILGAICIWCTAYGISLILRFVVALIVWLGRHDNDYDELDEGEDEVPGSAIG